VEIMERAAELLGYVDEEGDTDIPDGLFSCGSTILNMMGKDDEDENGNEVKLTLEQFKEFVTSRTGVTFD